MKGLEHVIAMLRNYFVGQPILKAWLFGSVSRGEDTPESDIDILVTFDPKAKVGLFKHAGMIDELETLLNRQVDLVPSDALYPSIRSSVEKDKILIYER